MRQSTNVSSGGLLIVAGHAIYQNGKWYGGWPNEERFYEQHVRDGFQIWKDENYQALVLSGGRTRTNDPEVIADNITNSEGEGLLEFARDAGLYTSESGVLVESYARDSFENVFFSMLRFFREFESWPSRVGIVSWKFKAVRFYLIACGLKLGDGRFVFYGSGDPDIQKTIEIVSVANAKYDASIVDLGKGEIHDPLHRDPHEFVAKRLDPKRGTKDRTPKEFKNNSDYLKQVKITYDKNFNPGVGKQGVAGDVIDTVERIQPGLSWRDIEWPWE